MFDNTSALRLDRRDLSLQSLPDPAVLLALQEQEAATPPTPTVPTTVHMVPTRSRGGGRTPARVPHTP
jgi:hypothetical protein